MERDPFEQALIDSYRRMVELYGPDVEIKVVAGSMVPANTVYVMPSEALREDATAEEIEAYGRRFGRVDNIGDDDPS